LRTEALAAIAVLALTLLSTLALAASPPSLASRTVAYLPYPQGLQFLPPYGIPVSPLPPYGILLLFLGSSGSYLAMFNISNRDYKVIAHFGLNIVPYPSPSAPMLCLSNLSNRTGIVYVAEVSPEGSISEEPLVNGIYLCTGLAEADGVIVASLMNVSMGGEVIVARQVGRSLEVVKSVSLPPGGMFVDLSPSPSGLLYGAYLKSPSSIIPLSNVSTYTIYPAYVNLSSGSPTVLNRFNMTLTLSSDEFPSLDSSVVSSSLIIYGGVYASVSPNLLYAASSVQPILIYFNTSTYRLLNVSDLMPPASAVFGAYWSPWGILISDAKEAWGRHNISYSPHLFLKPWGGPWGGALINETGLAPGQLVVGGLEVKGSYYLVAVNTTGRTVAVIEVYKKGLSWAYVIAPVVVVVIVAVSLAVLLRRR